MGLFSKAKAGANDTVREIIKDYWKKLRGWLGGLFLLYGLSAFQSFYNLDHTPSPSEAAWLMWSSLKALPSFIKQWAINPAYDFVVESPLHAAGIVFLIAGYVILIALLIRSDRKLSRNKQLAKDASANEALVKQAGIRALYPHAKVSGGGASWKALCEEIMLPENKFLYILGANGSDTFGNSSSPLFTTMEKFSGTVRVILSQPDSKPMVGRAKALGMIPQDYKRAIRTSERRLKDLRSQQHAVEGRFYQGEPNWKLIITSTTAWVQYYVPGGPHVEENAVWHLGMAPNKDGFYHLFHLEFNRVWERCKATSMKLT